MKFWCAEKCFLYRISLQELKNCSFSQNKSFPFTESFTLCPEKSLVFSTKTPLVRTTFYCPQKQPFHVQKTFFCTNLSLIPPKATLFCPPPPIRTPLNLLSTKNTAILLIFALILCCKAGASHRFKSLPAIPDEVAAFPKTGYLMITGHFRKKPYRPAI